MGDREAAPVVLTDIIGDLNRVRDKAERGGFPLLAFILDQAAAEARDQLAPQPAPPEPKK